jgi:citrate synthase
MAVRLGLEGVIALRSNISRVDEKGILEYRGYNINDLAKYSSYEEVAYLLWYECLPNKVESEAFSEDLNNRRNLSPEMIGLLSTLKNLPKPTHPTVVLRTAISYLGSLDKKLSTSSLEENLEKSKNLLAKLPTMIAYYQRMREGKNLVHPKQELGHAANFLWMLFGKKPDKTEEDSMDLDMILHAEHSLNASTFSARISASTLSDIYAGIVSATGTLFGPLHGGATQKVIETLREIRENNIEIEKWVDSRLSRNEKIMGFGHRVYKGKDPRSKNLEKLSEKIDNQRKGGWYSISKKLAETMKKRKRIYPNVDFYSALVYANLGIPDDLFINLFAMARIAGWTAHLLEQYKDNKLIRPLQEYSGEKNRKYIPLEKR